METVRAFIAIDIGSEIRARLVKLQEKLKTADADVRWSKPGNIHLTLAFLGNIAVSKLQLLEDALQDQVRGLEPFELTIHGTGVFGRRSRPSVVWAGIEENPALLQLQQRVVSAIGTAEIPFKNRRFRPHLTLGRFKSLNRLDELLQTLKNEQDTGFGTFPVDSIQTIQSELKPDGAQYSILQTIPLSETDRRTS